MDFGLSKPQANVGVSGGPPNLPAWLTVSSDPTGNPTYDRYPDGTRAHLVDGSRSWDRFGGIWKPVGFGALDPVWFGAIADGVVDDTVAVQATVDALPVNGVIDGAGRTYAVRSVHMHSDMVLQNVRFLTLPGTDNDASPVTVGANDAVVRKNIRFENVHVDGNRENQTGLVGDGNRHGFRFTGFLDNVILDNCSARNCATDGISVYPSSVGAFPWCTNLRMHACDFLGNRRVGMSGAGLRWLWADGCRFSENGLTVGVQVGIAPGWGIDLESEDPTHRSEDLRFTDCVLRDNQGVVAFGMYAHEVASALFRQSLNIFLEGCHVGGDVRFAYDPSQVPASGTCLYSRIGITNCTIVGQVQGSYVEGGFVGPMVNVGLGIAGAFDNSTDIVVQASGQAGKLWKFDGTNKSYQILGATFLTLAAGETLDLCVAPVRRMVRLWSSGGSVPPGGPFAALVYWDPTFGVHVAAIYNGQVGTTNAFACQLLLTGLGFAAIKNNTAAPMTLMVVFDG